MIPLSNQIGKKSVNLKLSMDDAIDISKLKEFDVKKGTILQREGDSILNAYVVKKGLLRSYTIDKKGKEHIFMFAPEGWAIADAEPQINSKPTQLYIDSLEDSKILIWDKPKFDFEDLTMEQMKVQLTKSMKRTLVLQNRVLKLMSAPAIERYHEFLTTYPGVSNRIPQHMIASYLGVTPEALSFAKKEYQKISKS